MPKYNLDSLGERRFEGLSQALIQRIIGPGARIYGMGRDGAREATFEGKAPYPSDEERWDGKWIFQVKFHHVQQLGPSQARKLLMSELDDELSKIITQYQYQCDNYILITNVSLTPVFQTGTKDKIDNQILPKYRSRIKNIHVWGADEVCRFLDSFTGIRQSYNECLVTGDIIARLLKLFDSGESELDETVKIYCQSCSIHEQYANLDEAGDYEEHRVELQKVFIDLNVSPSSPHHDPLTYAITPEWLLQAIEDKERTSALSYLLDDSIPDLILVGGPGSGKSTLGQFLAQIYRAQLLGKLKEIQQPGNNIQLDENFAPRIPFRIILKEYAQWISKQKNHFSLLQYIACQVSQETGIDTDPKEIKKIIKSNSTLLILDGLDEVSDPGLRTMMMDNISIFFQNVREVLKGNLKTVATTRPFGYSDEFDPSKFLHLNLKPLNPDQATHIARLWTRARRHSPSESERIINTFTRCLSDNIVRFLTHTPLQVSILLVTIRGRGTPPKQREELFHRYMDLIYQREQKKLLDLIQSDFDTIYGLHKYIGYLLQKQTEKAQTAALMEISEFESQVSKYMNKAKPLLNEQELKHNVERIIKEARERLVLIESPQEGKIGFGLTTIREFFAAAYLVDEARSSEDRAAIFKSISRSPHWRNTALFFGGRVGRALPGEASNLVDICREIDTEGADKYLKRGTQLALEMLDDRVFRVQHNEIGAITYALEILGSGFIKNYDEWINKLKDFSDIYKDRIIRPWLEGRLKNLIAESLKLYVSTYEDLFGFNDLLKHAVGKALKCNLKEINLWALSYTFKHQIADPLVLESLEQSMDIITMEELSDTLVHYWPQLFYYFSFPISFKIKMLLINCILKEQYYYREIIAKLGKMRPRYEGNEDFFFIWSSANLLLISADETIWAGLDLEVKPPPLANIRLRNWVNKHKNQIQALCSNQAQPQDPFTGLIVSIFQYLLESERVENLKNISKYISPENCDENTRSVLNRIAGLLRLNDIFTSEEKIKAYFHFINQIYKAYKDEEERYREDFKELNRIINRHCKEKPIHPYRLVLWIHFDHSAPIGKYLNSEIFEELKNWIEARHFSKDTLQLLYLTYRQSLWDQLAKNRELIQLTFQLINTKVLDENTSVDTIHFVAYFILTVSRSIHKRNMATRLKHILEKIISEHSSTLSLYPIPIGTLYWASFELIDIDEAPIIRVYEIVKNITLFPQKICIEPYRKEIDDTILKMLKSKNPEVNRLAAISLPLIFKINPLPKRDKKLNALIREKLWELVKNKEDRWAPRYVEGLAQCKINWKQRADEWHEEIRKADTDALQHAWSLVIKKGDYYNKQDLDALYQLLLSILNSDTQFPKIIRESALQRLHDIIYKIEHFSIDELNLTIDSI